MLSRAFTTSGACRITAVSGASSTRWTARVDHSIHASIASNLLQPFLSTSTRRQGRLYHSSTSVLGVNPNTKIVATIGPASENMPMLDHVVNAGMRIMRINFSHATFDEANLRVASLKKCSAFQAQESVEGKRTVITPLAVLLDTQGPEIRTGSFAGPTKEVELVAGNKITLTTDSAFQNNQSAEKIWVSYKKLTAQGVVGGVVPGAVILLDDGAVGVEVLSVQSETEVECTVLNTGMLGNKKGVNLPGMEVDLPPMSEKDKIDIRWGIENDVDFIAASFVRKAADVHQIRAFLRQLVCEREQIAESEYASIQPAPRLPHIISKIENIEALDNFDSILAASDGIMIARGDLAVEIPMHTLANVQKDLVQRCNHAGKPVIVATQMLESMQKNPRPTRAECTDVANAVYDGTDCVMLSGESAKGKYPIEAVTMLKSIADQTEGFSQFSALHPLSRGFLQHIHCSGNNKSNNSSSGGPDSSMSSSSKYDLFGKTNNGCTPTTTTTTATTAVVVTAVGEVESGDLSAGYGALGKANGVAYAAVQAANAMKDVHGIIVVANPSAEDPSKEDLVSRIISQYRPSVPVICVLPTTERGIKRAKQLQVYKSLHPVNVDLKEYHTHMGQRVQPSRSSVRNQLSALGFECLQAQDQFILVHEEKLCIYW